MEGGNKRKMGIKALILAMVIALLGATIMVDGEKPKVERLEMYLHHTYNVTAVRVAGPGGDTSSTQFGSIFVIDDIVRGGSSTNSIQLGRAKGIVAVASDDLSNSFYAFTMVLETSSYINASLSFQGTNKAGELDIVGGTQYFRLAHGYAQFTIIRDEYPYRIASISCTIFLPTSIMRAST